MKILHATATGPENGVRTLACVRKRWLCGNGGKPEMASLGVWCTLRKQRIWFDSRRDVALGVEGLK